MSGKKTPEEKRAKNRERQRKWRSNNLAFAQLKERNAARIRRGTMEPMGPPAPNVHLTKGISAPNSGISAPNAMPGYGKTYSGPVEGVDVPYNEGGQPGPVPGREAIEEEPADIDPPPAMSQAPTRVASAPGDESESVTGSEPEPPREGTAHAEAQKKLHELVARKAAGKLNRATGPGVEVELKL